MFTNWLAPPSASLPPDTVIEVGSPPFTRYAAHSALVSAHSGYLRAALRSERSTGSTETVPIYVPNVTADQFTPLLTYMYTGFLDLNIENIFGVLLATHILHMPRALELCRAFLSATQTENYFNGLTALSAAASNVPNISKQKPELENSKVVRPIASKATGIGLNFIAPPASHILLPSIHTPFKSLSTVGPPSTFGENTENSSPSLEISEMVEVTEEVEPIEKPPKSTADQPSTKSPKEPSQKRQSTKASKRTNISTKSESTIIATGNPISKDNNSNTTADKGVIIDIASCDGPVRFRRVLNDSYGMNSPTNSNTICAPNDELKNRYMSSSFHQQMVRNINERRLTAGESYNSKDENSQDNNHAHQSSSTTSSSSTSGGGGGESTNSTGTVYNCVYCKHTFKSQYCYQKHAKRHLIPLSLNATMLTDELAAQQQQHMAVAQQGQNMEKEKDNLTVRFQSKAAANKREVKPLDMNVQYYPCKTCGSKFPSYYFVHKHRKMCHADEEVL
ncbi:uncharacterized protein LOC129750018 [Uranotaenia lowii]|uniref:uncharacterized protein LOC129750018 n=1 Tax=Uranotaenia lowii TaxID=190385 RepID=UPI00247A1C04|nr:uncharacterized protein LOC129750018 [Uranotaenia lowii]